MKKKPKSWLEEHKAVVIVIILLLFFAGCTGCISLIGSKPKEDFDYDLPKPVEYKEPQQKEVSKVIEKPKTVEEDIISILGVKNNMGKIRIRGIDNLAGDGSLMSIHFNADENWGPTWSRDGAVDDAIDVMKKLFQNYPNLKTITMFAYFPTMDKYGNEEYNLGLKMMLNKGTAQKINWKNMFPDNFKNILDDYRELLRFE